MNYIKLPINFSNALKGNRKDTCSLEESIAQFIMTQITCRYGEVAGKPDFGSEIWNLEFNQLVKIYEWEEKVKKSLFNTIEKYEKRLTNIEVNVSLSEIDNEVQTKGYSEIRRKAIIFVNGNIIHSGVPFHFNTTIYISPLSQ